MYVRTSLQVMIDHTMQEYDLIEEYFYPLSDEDFDNRYKCIVVCKYDVYLCLCMCEHMNVSVRAGKESVCEGLGSKY